ncbi:MAG: zinc-binding dehydrogenase [Hymenobacter sp.]
MLFDAASGDTLAHSLAALKPGGRLVSVLNDGKQLTLPAGVQFTHLFTQLSVPDLEHLRDLADAGHLQVPIAQAFPLTLAGITRAFEQMESKHTGAKSSSCPRAWAWLGGAPAALPPPRGRRRRPHRLGGASCRAPGIGHWGGDEQPLVASVSGVPLGRLLARRLSPQNRPPFVSPLVLINAP